MNRKQDLERLGTLWKELYDGDYPTADEELRVIEERIANCSPPALPQAFDENPQWYKGAVVYALYVQHFNRDFEGLVAKLDYLKDLGVNCLWLLPILESPMRDEGFDISDFYSIRADLFSPGLSPEERQEHFRSFLAEAHARGIRVIFDIALNHISSDHAWFRKAIQDPGSPEFHYFHWSDSGKEHQKARIIFKGMLDSNWEFEPRLGKYYFHRFYPHQPDLNYANPRLLREMLEVLLFWIGQGVDGFRADAAPYLWKDDATHSENHPKTHQIMKIFRAVSDLAKPSTLLLAEACQPPKEVVDYFGQGDECQGAYHFPLMPRLFLALSRENGEVIRQVLSPEVTPEPPESGQWFTFLRVHDELTLEMVSPEERKEIHSVYCRKPEWDFRAGEGISARLIDLLQDPKRVLLGHALLLGLAGTPVIYYGDEVLVANNEEFNRSWAGRTGYTDSRNLARGPLDWEHIGKSLARPDSKESLQLSRLSELIRIRREEECFAARDQELTSQDTGLFLIQRHCPGSSMQLSYNLSRSRSQAVKLPEGSTVLFAEGYKDGELAPSGFLWLRFETSAGQNAQ